MAKKKEEPTTQKFTRVYEDEDSKSIWTYDLSKTKSGPVSVEIQYKGELAKLYKERERKVKKSKKKIGKKVAK